MTSEPQPTPEDIKQQISSLFNIVADGYDNPSTQFFQFCADKMLEILQPTQNTRLLDIATGTGAVAISAAQMISPEGRVHGIDLSTKMLDVAFKNAQKMALSNIELHEMDAEKPIFDADYFHYITCSFGLFFLPDMTAALKNWLRILRPDGQLIFSTFGPSAFTPQTELFREQLKKYNIEIPDTHWFRLSDTKECKQILNDAGYADISVHTKQLGYHLLNAEDWWQLLWNTGYRGFLNQLSASDLVKFKKNHLAEVQELAAEDGIWLNVEAIFSKAFKPS